jgi:Domain of unknown function (DUF4192)/Inner membrane component of T3SS, cytoplasmic domain
MNSAPDQPRVRITSPAGILAVIPHLLGFTPEASFVVLGSRPQGRVEVTIRYDLPDREMAADIAAHAAGILAREHLTVAMMVGYGPGPLVTPVADAARAAAGQAGLKVHDLLRVQDSRYWSYLCTDTSCCSPDGVPFDTAGHPAVAALTGQGLPVVADRAALAATIAPLAGPAANEMLRVTKTSERTAARLITRHGPRALEAPGLAAVQAAIEIYRDGAARLHRPRPAYPAPRRRPVHVPHDAAAAGRSALMRGPSSQAPAPGRPPPGGPGGQAGQETGGPPVLTITATGQRIALHAEITVIGRGDRAGIRLDDPSVSVLHADLVRRGPHTYVADLGRSARGTWVNGRPVAWMLLAAGDVLHVGAAAAVITGLALWAADRDGLPAGRGMPGLTCREASVLAALCRPALRYEADIAAIAPLTGAAVEQHLLRLYGKLGISEGPDRRARLASAAAASLAGLPAALTADLARRAAREP